LYCLGLFAQTKQIEGHVYDKVQSSPFRDVSILVVSSSDLILTAFKSESDGSFQIAAPANASKIVFSAVGYKKQEMNISSIAGALRVVLQVDDNQIEAVDIVAQVKPDADLGFVNINKRELSSSIASIDMKGIENLPVVSV